MVPLTSLWLPILVSAVIVFVASSIIHMALPYHRNDFRKLPAEDGVMTALRGFDIPPGDYVMPRPETRDALKSPEYLAKVNQGPVAVMTVRRPGPVNTGKSLGLWFLYCVVVNVFAAYVGSRAVGAGASYLEVFRFVGTVAFTGYTLALWQASIWYWRAWSTTLKSTLDGLVYALLTAGTFGWLWPK